MVLYEKIITKNVAPCQTNFSKKDGDCTSSEIETSDHEKIRPLSISLEESGLPSQVFCPVWMKASKLISQKSMIVDAPGCDIVKVVASYTSPQPHFVRLFQSKDKLIIQSRLNFDSANQFNSTSGFSTASLDFNANPGCNWQVPPYPWGSTSVSMVGPHQFTDYREFYHLPSSYHLPPAPPFNPYQQPCSYVPYHGGGQSSSDSSHRNNQAWQY